MRVIWKAPLIGGTLMLIPMPVDATVRTVMVQDDVPTIWFEGSDDVFKANRRVWIVGTGIIGELEGVTGDYIGSFQLGWLVGHVYADRAPVAMAR